MRIQTYTKLILGVFLAEASLLPVAFAGGSDPYCDNICSALIENGKVKGLSGPTWTTADDAACAAMSSGASPSPSPSSSPGSDTAAITTSIQCQYHSGQVAQQCMAYEADSQGGKGEKILMALDIATAGTCWAACFNLAAPAMQQICSYAGMAAGAADVLESMAMKSSAVGKAINVALGGAGIAGGFMAMKGAKVAGVKMACAEAALMTVMAGMRMKSSQGAKDSKQKACNAIKSLSSNANVVGGANPLVATSGNTGATQVSDTSATNAPLTDGFATGVTCAKNGLGSGGCGMSGDQMAATDGGNLESTGIAKAVAPLAPNPDEILRQLDSGASPGAAMGGALGGLPNSASVSALATAAGDHAAEIGVPKSGAVESAGGGGGASKTEEFHMSFGAGAAAGSAEPELKFSAPAPEVGESGDIWHAGSPNSIFEIITQKIQKSKDRVEKLEWQTPLNRALAGLPKSKAKAE